MPLPNLVKFVVKKIKNRYRKIDERPSSDFIKQGVVKKYSNNIDIFIETGTFLGEMLDAVKNDFRKLYSVEISRELYKKAKRRLKNYKHVVVENNDSAFFLKKILPKIKQPCVFWLDAHFSGGDTQKGKKITPIIEELECIFANYQDGSVILIDDARLFNGEHDYPTIKELKEYIQSKNVGVKFLVKNDIIIIA